MDGIDFGEFFKKHGGPLKTYRDPSKVRPQREQGMRSPHDSSPAIDRVVPHLVHLYRERVAVQIHGDETKTEFRRWDCDCGDFRTTKPKGVESDGTIASPVSDDFTL